MWAAARSRLEGNGLTVNRITSRVPLTDEQFPHLHGLTGGYGGHGGYDQTSQVVRITLAMARPACARP